MTHSHVHVFVQLGSEVAWHLTAAVVVAVILGDVVNIMEDQAVPVQVLHGLQESHVKQHGSVEGLAPTLNTHILMSGTSFTIQNALHTFFFLLPQIHTA